MANTITAWGSSLVPLPNRVYSASSPESFHELLPRPLLPPQSAPRVLFASHDLSLSGAPLVLYRLLPRLRGMTVSVYSPVDGPLKARFLEEGISVTHTLDLAGVDLLVANTLLSTPAVAAAKVAGMPCVWLIHEFTPNTCGNLDAVRAIIDYPQSLFFCHPASAENFQHLRTRNVHVIYSCIYPAPIRDRVYCRQALELASGDFCIVTMGRDEPRKGQADLREATAALAVRVFCVTGDPDPWTYYAAADLYVCTSREESFGLSLQEAKQYGIPVITTDLPSCKDIIHDGVHGLHYEPGDVADLRTKIEQLRANPELRAKLSAPVTHLPSFLEMVERYETAFLDAAGYYRDQPVHVVYHVAGIGEHWQGIVTEQLEQLRGCGLTRVLCTHVGVGLDWLLDEARRRGVDLTICQHEPDVGNCEVLAIRLIERLARTSDKPILYLHTKGASRPLSEAYYHEWRRLMMAALVIRWCEHLPALADHDAVGVNWWDDPKGHFSGNFWLASAAWLRRLPRFDSYYRDRYSCERWIGSVAGCKARSLICSNRKFWAEDMAFLLAQREKLTSPDTSHSRSSRP